MGLFRIPFRGQVTLELQIQNPQGSLRSKLRIMAEQMVLSGTLKGHNGWVTQIATTPQSPDNILSASRDKSLILWELTPDDDKHYGVPKRALYGHNHFVSDVVLSSDGQFALSGSWDSNLRLWDLSAGKTTRQFTGHTKDVLGVAFSADNRQIVSGSRDKTIKLGILLVSASTPSVKKHIQNGFLMS